MDRHHLHFLVRGFDGRAAGLVAANSAGHGQRYGRLGDAAGEYTLTLPLATLVRLERWQDVLAEPLPTEGLGVLRAYVAFARGYGLCLHTGQLAQAGLRPELARLRGLPAVQQARMG